MNDNEQIISVESIDEYGIEWIKIEGHIGPNQLNKISAELNISMVNFQKHILIDLAKTTYICVEVIVFLLNIADQIQSKNGKVAVFVDSDPINDMFVLTGAQIRMKIFKSKDEAIQYLSAEDGASL